MVLLHSRVRGGFARRGPAPSSQRSGTCISLQLSHLEKPTSRPSYPGPRARVGPPDSLMHKSLSTSCRAHAYGHASACAVHTYACPRGKRNEMHPACPFPEGADPPVVARDGAHAPAPPRRHPNHADGHAKSVFSSLLLRAGLMAPHPHAQISSSSLLLRSWREAPRLLPAR